MTGETLELRREWQEATPFLQSLQQTLRLIVTEELFPRLAYAAYINPQRSEEVSEALQQLQKSPAMPVVVVPPSGIHRVLEQTPQLATLPRFPNVRVVPVVDSETGATFIAGAVKAFRNPRQKLDAEEKQTAGERARQNVRHDLNHALQGHGTYDKNALLSRARVELGYTGTDDEIVEAVMQGTGSAVDRVREYMDLPAACIDWAGTLRDNRSGHIHLELLERVTEEARQRNVAPVIWTGSDPENVYTALRKAGVASVGSELHVCSKWDCSGLRATLAIADEPLKDLHAKYALDAAEFMQVQEGKIVT